MSRVTGTKIIALSDMHIDSPGYPERCLSLDDYAHIAENMEADVLIIGGDIAKTKKGIAAGLDIFKGFKGLKLAYLGNHEIRALETSVMREHYSEMGNLFNCYGFHLLDQGPCAYGKIGFVGNCGWFDFSLFKGQGYEAKAEKALQYHQQTHPTAGKSPQQFTNDCVEKVGRHLRCISHQAKKIVLGIHHIAFEDFLLYSHSELYDYKNLLMGSRKFAGFYEHQNVAIGLCGHTHRPGMIKICGKPIYNINSDKTQPFVSLII